MPRPPNTSGSDTRERILDIALELFTQHGYDKTSLRDIAERLDMTKAALYYYFERKEDILLELHLRLHDFGSDLLDELEAIADGNARYAAWPGLMDRLIHNMVTNRDVLRMHRRNQSAIAALHADERNRLEHEELDKRVTGILSSSALSIQQRLRMAAAVGLMSEIMVESVEAFADIPTQELVGLVQGLVADIVGVSDAEALTR